MAKFSVLQIAPKLDLGGTEKTLQLITEHLNHELFNVSVCGWVSAGVRAEQLKEDGFKVFCTHNSKQQLIRLLRREEIQIMHVHRSGFGDDFTIEAAHGAKVPVIVETNVFGRVDETRWERYIDCHLLISKMCALRCKNWVDVSWNDFLQRHGVLYYPVDLVEIDRYHSDPEKVDALRQKHRIPADVPVVGRIGRPSPAKWPAPESFTAILQELVALVPDLRILLMGAPREILESLTKTSFYDKVISLEPTAETEKVLEFYSLIDVLLHQAKIGESFGLVIAEAMAMGKPVVTQSTPLHDNAQVELIDHGKNGYVAYDEKSLAQATADLLLNREKRREMGLNARRKVETCYEVSTVTRQLERLYLQLLHKKGIEVEPSLWEQYDSVTVSPSREEIVNFEEEYLKRIRTCWGRPNWFEVLGYEYLLRSHLVYNVIRKTKKFLLRY